MPHQEQTTYRSGQLVPVKVSGVRVSATYVKPHANLGGYHIVSFGGKNFPRKILSGPIETAIADESIETTITASVRTFDINTRFIFLEKMVDMVLAGPSASLVICGDGGLGKSFIVRNRLVEHAYKADFDFKLIKGSITPKSIYRTLYNNRDKVIVFDDCDSAFGSVDAVNVLKAALETDPNEPRNVSWISERIDDDLPNNFTFTGKVILISNKPMLDVPQSLLSRSLHVDVTMSADEKMQRLEHLAPRIRPELPMEAKREVLDLMFRLRDVTADLNIRTFLKVCDIRVTNPEIWQDMSEYTLTSTRSERSES